MPAGQPEPITDKMRISVDRWQWPASPHCLHPQHAIALAGECPQIRGRPVGFGAYLTSPTGVTGQEKPVFWQPKVPPDRLLQVEAYCLFSAKGAADMKRTYVFRDLDENLITTVESEMPIAHLAVGVNLLLRTGDYAPKPESWLHVEHIMVGATFSGAEPVHETVGVICSIQNTQSTSVAQGHMPNSYRDMIE
jgi:hypothetical protein